MGAFGDGHRTTPSEVVLVGVLDEGLSLVAVGEIVTPSLTGTLAWSMRVDDGFASGSVMGAGH